jgi:hypothetical protein
MSTTQLYFDIYKTFLKEQQLIRKLNKEKVDYYYNLYFTTKKRKDLRRCAKSRIMKDAEKNWQLFKSIEVHHINILDKF